MVAPSVSIIYFDKINIFTELLGCNKQPINTFLNAQVGAAINCACIVGAAINQSFCENFNRKVEKKPATLSRELKIPHTLLEMEFFSFILLILTSCHDNKYHCCFSYSHCLNIILLKFYIEPEGVPTDVVSVSKAHSGIQHNENYCEEDCIQYSFKLHIFRVSNIH